MVKYICQQCGFEVGVEVFDVEQVCPICKGTIISEEVLKENREIENLIGDNKDDNIFTDEDTFDDTINFMIIQAMQKNIKELGNDKTWQMIENNIIKAEQRARYRKYFIKVGGKVPEGERINI